jgi:hypothetical protein
MAIKVLIADDTDLMRQAMRKVIERLSVKLQLLDRPCRRLPT